MKTKALTAQVYAEFFTIKDKKRVVSAPQPDMHFVRICVLHKDKTIVVREDIFEDKKQANSFFTTIRQQFK